MKEFIRYLLISDPNRATLDIKCELSIAGGLVRPHMSSGETTPPLVAIIEGTMFDLF